MRNWLRQGSAIVAFVAVAIVTVACVGGSGCSLMRKEATQSQGGLTINQSKSTLAAFRACRKTCEAGACDAALCDQADAALQGQVTAGDTYSSPARPQ